MKWLKLAAAGLLVLLIIGFIRDPFGIRTWWKHRGEIATVEQQADLNTEVGRITERTLQTEVQTRHKADEGVADVLQLPGAETPIASQRRDRLCAALERVFDGSGGCEPHPAPDATGAVSKADNADADAGG